MQIRKIKLENFRGFKKQSIELLPNINVFVGVNGAGKSTILDAVSISLSWLVEGIQKADSRGMRIPDESIKNDTNSSSIYLEILEKNIKYSWQNIEFKRGHPADKKSNFYELDKLIHTYQTKYQNENILPMIAYYPINRIAKGISGLDIFGHENIAQLDVYDNALGSKANFQAFFEWFRLQDDIINEQAQSRSKWMQKNKRWIGIKLSKIFRILDDLDNKEFKFMKEKLLDNDFLLEEPRFLFYELIHIVEESNFIKENRNTDIIFDDLKYLFHQMAKLSDMNHDNKIGIDDFPFRYLERISHQVFKLIDKNNPAVIAFIWNIFEFATLISFWWLSTQGRTNIERIFHRYRPSIRSEHGFIKAIKDALDEDLKRVEQALSTDGRELLKIVTKTIEKFIPEYSNLRVTRIPTPHMLVEKNGETVRLDQLSDGEKNMIAMIGDIARRLSMANPRMENPLEGDGIVLIDEIDLHLHPLWQRVIVSRLTEVFPNCQFIVSTHSPQVLSHVKAEHIFILQPINDDVDISKPTESYGKSTDRQLEDILGVEARPLKIKEKLHELFVLIQEQKLDDAKAIMKELEEEIEGREPELVKASVLIKRKEILGK
ncbi:MAG: AAA family ATPase [Sulfurovum sp.]|nr:AAA family ATPase [Sulfurovum sp.]